MTRTLKVSGFLGLTVQMLWGLGNNAVHMPFVSVPTGWEQIVGAHAHFGVLGILAVATGLAMDHYGTSGTRKRVVTWTYILGQWLLPGTLVVQGYFEMPQLGTLTFLWGLLLVVAMALMTLEALGESSA